MNRRINKREKNMYDLNLLLAYFARGVFEKCYAEQDTRKQTGLVQDSIGEIMHTMDTLGVNKPKRCTTDAKCKPGHCINGYCVP